MPMSRGVPPILGRYVQLVFIEFYNLGQELPSPRYSLFLEVIAKRPVAQHLEHRMVVCVVSDLLDGAAP